MQYMFHGELIVYCEIQNDIDLVKVTIVKVCFQLLSQGQYWGLKAGSRPLTWLEIETIGYNIMPV